MSTKLATSLTAAVFVGVVVTIQNAVTALARRNTLSIAAPKIASSTIYVEQQHRNYSKEVSPRPWP